MSRVASLIRAILSFSILSLTACGDDGDSPHSGGGGTSSAGRGGTASAGNAAQGGASAASSAGGSAGAGEAGGTVAGADGTGARAGSSSGGSSDGDADALDPSLPEPSFDCLKATDVQCLSIRGAVDGRPVDGHCTHDFLGMATFADPNAWIISCYEATASEGLYDLVTVPIQPVGGFDYSVMPNSPYVGASVTAAYDDVGGSSTGDHIVSSRLKGSVRVANDDLGALVSGSFNLTTSAPADAACHAGSPSICAAVEVHGTFRFIHSRRD